MHEINIGAAFLLGLLGGMHCVGMCGGIIAALSAGRGVVWWPGVAAYQMARVVTYVLLGLIVSLAGTLLGTYSFWSGTQKGISIFAGIVIIVFALQLGGWLPERWGRLPFLIPTPLLKKASATDSLGAWGAVGFFNGLLPCGLVYAALAMTLASGSALNGALIMLAFGLGTVPALFMVSAVMRLAGPAIRGRLIQAMALMLIIFGGWTMARGFITHEHHAHYAPAGVTEDAPASEHAPH